MLVIDLPVVIVLLVYPVYLIAVGAGMIAIIRKTVQFFGDRRSPRDRRYPRHPLHRRR